MINEMDEHGAVPLPDIAWKMFEQTGQTGFYMLYSDLKNENYLE